MGLKPTWLKKRAPSCGMSSCNILPYLDPIYTSSNRNKHVDWNCPKLTHTKFPQHHPRALLNCDDFHFIFSWRSNLLLTLLTYITLIYLMLTYITFWLVVPYTHLEK